MKPSDCSTSSTRPRRVDAGVETTSRRRIWALRMRVSISPSGSERLIVFVSLPARLHQARDLPEIAEFAQGDTAHLELAIVGARTARHFAAVADAVRSRITRQFGELEGRRKALLQRHLLVHDDGLERGALGAKLLGQLLAAVVL